jgi:hypothetical protein
MDNLISVIDLFKKSFDAYWARVWSFIGMSLFSLLSIVVLLPFGIVVFAISFIPFRNGNYNPTLILVDVLLILLGIFFAIIFGLWSRVALFVLTKEQNMGVKEALSVSWPKIASFFWVSLLLGLAVLGGYILVIIPGIIFGIWFCFSPYVFIEDGTKGTAALKKSKELVKGYWWPVFGRIMLLAAVVILISWIKFFGPIINIIFSVPFSVIYVYYLYQDIKQKKTA